MILWQETNIPGNSMINISKYIEDGNPASFTADL